MPRKRRYESASGLGEDVRRHLGYQPVRARPPSRLYNLRRSVRRHRVWYAAGALAAGALAVGLGAALWQWTEKGHALQRATSAESEQSRLREAAEARAEELRARNYASDMNAAKRALDAEDFGEIRRLLDRHRPSSAAGQTDLRGWEWRYLWQQARSDATANLLRRENQIVSLSSSPDGRWLATGVAHEGGVVLIDLFEEDARPACRRSLNARSSHSHRQVLC